VKRHTPMAGFPERKDLLKGGRKDQAPSSTNCGLRGGKSKAGHLGGSQRTLQEQTGSKERRS